MTICVSVKTRDGVVLGTDSMTTVLVPSAEGQPFVAKTYSNARKLAKIGSSKVGVFSYGIGSLGSRTVYSYILEYSKMNEEVTVQGIADGLAAHIKEEYGKIAEAFEDKPVLGLYVAGYSENSALPEEWEVEFPNLPKAQKVRDLHEFGACWRGIPLPFGRLYNGYDPRLFQLLEQKGVSIDILNEVVEENSLAAEVLLDSMPLQDAINFAVYILRTTIGFTSFEIGPPSCGGQLQIAVISEESGYEWVSEPKFRIPEDTNEWA